MVLPWYALVSHPINTIYIKIYLAKVLALLMALVPALKALVHDWPTLLTRFSYSLTAFFTSLFMGSSIKERREDLERVLPTTMD